MTEAPVATANKAQPSASSIRNARRQELRELNSSVWDGVQGLYPVAQNLDSTLKKNTAFIKRCRVNLVEDSQAALLNDISTVSLEKYLSEILAALCEGFTKCKSSADLFTGVEVASALHQRFGNQFSPQLLSFFFQGISHPPKAHLDALIPEARVREDQARIDRHKIVLRVLIELWLVNVFRFTSDVIEAGYEVPRWALNKSSNGISLPPPLSSLEEVLNYDMEDFSGASIAVVILKNYGQTLTGISKPKANPGLQTDVGDSQEESQNDSKYEGTKLTSGSKSDPSLVSLVLPDIQRLFFKIFQAYTLAFQSKLKEMARQARRMEKQNADAYIRIGKIVEERKEGLENLLVKFQALHINCTNLSEYLGIPMPDYKVSNETEEGVLISLANALEDGGLWDDDEQKKFYEDVIDLSYLAEENGKPTDDGEIEKNDDESDSDSDSEDEEKPKPKIDEKDQKLMDELDEIMNADEEPEPEVEKELELGEEQQERREGGSSTRSNNPPLKQSNDGEREIAIDEFEDTQDNPEDGIPSEPNAGTRISELLSSLSTNQSRSNVDSMAIEFVSLNNKASRNKLVSFFTTIPIPDQYKLPFYARFIATIDPFCKDVTAGVLEHIDSFFRYLQRHRKAKALTSRRMFNIRYLSELIKFGIVPKHIVFHKLKTMIARLDNVNVENIFTMFECCGRYLMRKPDTHLLMAKMVQVLEFQKDKKFFPVDVKAMINGALQYVNPPPKIDHSKVRPVMELYIRKLIYYDLSKETSSAILTQLRRMDWNDKETFQALRKVFTKIWKVKYVNIGYMAWFIGSFVSTYRSFVVIVIDSLLENIRRGLETNSFEFNQKRISEIKFLAELARYRIVSEDVIYDVLFMLISFGHPNGRPRPGVFSELDPPNEFFRIRLICTLLESPGVSIRLNKDVKKFELLVAFLQFYIFTKDPMSMDIEFQVRDTFEALDIRLVKTTQQASNALQIALNKYNGIESPKKSKTVEDEEAEAELTAELMATVEGAAREEEDIIEEPLETEEEKLIREEQERIKKLEAKRVHAARADIKAMAQVEREFQKLMIDRMDRKSEDKITLFDEPVPSIRNPNSSDESISSSTSSSSSASTSKVGYKLLTKKVGKAQMVDVNVPSDSKFAINVGIERTRLQHEHNKIRDFVLNYEYDQNTEPKLRKIAQPEIQSTRYSKLKRRTAAPTIDDIKL